MSKFVCKLVGHKWRQVCTLCIESRYHVDEHLVVTRCARCGMTTKVERVPMSPFEPFEEFSH